MSSILLSASSCLVHLRVGLESNDSADILETLARASWVATLCLQRNSKIPHEQTEDSKSFCW